MSEAKVIRREDDGVTHINIWSKAKTELGQSLSNFANTPFTHPEYGTFASVEALWYWLATGKIHNELRRLYGMSAKTYGSRLLRVEMDEAEFRKIICEAFRCKIEQHPKLKEAFTRSTLPLEHYFVYGRNMETIVDQRKKHGWQTDFLEQLRDEYRSERGWEPANKSEQTPRIVATAEPDPVPQTDWARIRDEDQSAF
jgi:hypothetical protein